jgi:hypothetical protein
MKNHALALFVAFCIVFCSGALCAQQRGKNRGGQQNIARPGFIRDRFASAEYDKTPFDMTIENLLPAYTGHDSLAVYDMLNNAKKSSLTEDRLSGNVYAFQVRPMEIYYNSRGYVLNVNIELVTILTSEAEKKAKRGFMVRYEPQMDNRFTYTDAKGKKIEIEEVKFREYIIVFDYPAAFPVERIAVPSVTETMEKKSGKGNPETNLFDILKKEVISVGFNVQPSEAAQLRESTRLLVLCNLELPYTASMTVKRKGTLEKPGEYSAEYSYLYVRLLELWFYDVITGKVMMKIKPVKMTYTP